MNKIFIGVLTLGTLAIVAYSVTAKSKPIPVDCIKVTKGNISSYIPDDGKTILERDYIITTSVDGTVTPILFKEGDFIKKGEIIARFDNFNRTEKISELNSKINELNAMTEGVDASKTKQEDIESAKLKVKEADLNLSLSKKQKNISEIELKQIEKDYLRNKMLYNQQAISKETFDQSKKTYDIAMMNFKNANTQELTSTNNLKISQLALEKIQKGRNDNEYQRKAYKAQVEQVKNEISIINHEISTSNIYSEYSGPVLDVFARDKMAMPAGSKLLRIGNLSTIAVESDILSEEVPGIKVGMPVEISGKALGNTIIIGKVSRIFPIGFTKISALGVEQQRIKVIISYDNSKLKIRPETYVDIKIIPETHKNTLIIPESSVFKDKEKWYVFSVSSEKKLEVKEIKIGLKNEDNNEILKGLQANDFVLSESDTKIKPGTKVICQ